MTRVSVRLVPAGRQDFVPLSSACGRVPLITGIRPYARYHATSDRAPYARYRAAAANQVILGEMPVSCLGAEFAVEFDRAEVKHSGVWDMPRR